MSALSRFGERQGRGAVPAVVQWSGRRLGTVLLVAALGGCAASSLGSDTAGPPSTTALAQSGGEACMDGADPAPSVQDRQYRVQPADTLAISFYLSPEFDQEVTVRPDGKISLRLVGDQEVRGLSAPEIAQLLDRVYAKELRAPEATVLIKSTPGRRVYVQGEVAHPGAVSLQPGMTALQAIAEAGGLTDSAGADRAILIRRDGCGNPHGSRFDLAQALKLKDGDEDVVLLPADIVVVPRSRIADLDLFVKQYVRDLLPVQPYLSPTF